MEHQGTLAVVTGGAGGIGAATCSVLARETAKGGRMVNIGSDGVAVNCVCPGLTETALLDSFRARKPKWIDAVVATIPMRRSGRPDETAEVISFLASARASYVTGQILSVNGGLTMVG